MLTFFLDIQNTSNQNVSTMQVQTVESKENNSKNVLVPKKIEHKPSTSTTGKVTKLNFL